MLDGRLDPALCLLLTRQERPPAPAVTPAVAAVAATRWLPLLRDLLRFRAERTPS